MERVERKRNNMRNKMAKLCPKDEKQLSSSEAGVRIEQLEKYYAEFKAAQGEIEDALFGDDPNLRRQEAIDFEGDQLYMQIKSKLKSMTLPDDNKVNQTPQELKVQEFHGDYKYWSLFKNSFTAIITNNPDLSGAEKLDLLKTSTKGRANDEIKNINDFELAWNALESKFSNKRYLVYTHLKRLIYLKKAETGGEVKNLYNTVHKILQALEDLKQPENNSLLVCLIRTKLPYQVVLAWEKSMNSNHIPKFEELSDFLKSYIQNLGEVTEPPSKSADSNRPTTPNPTYTKPIQTHDHICSLCKGNHMITTCPEFRSLNIDQRWSTVANLGVCENCLKGKHPTVECKSTIRCFKCKKIHNVLLHKDSENTNPQTNTNTNAPATYSITRPATPLNQTNRDVSSENPSHSIRDSELFKRNWPELFEYGNQNQ